VKNTRTFLALALCLSLVACTVDQVLSDIDVVIQIAGNIGVAVGGVSAPDAAIIATFTSIATDGIGAIQTAYNSYKASNASTDLQKLQAAIGAVQQNLAQELAAAHVSDPATQQKVSAWVALINSSVAAIAAALPQLQSNGIQAHNSTVQPAMPLPETIQSRWVHEVCQDNAKCGKKVKVHHRGSFWSSFGNALGEAKYGH
jgi:hypothetical protein